MAAVSLVQGASRGIGLQFCRTLLARGPDSVVIATCRSPNSATDLQKLSQQYPSQLRIHQLDITSEADIEKTSRIITGETDRLDLLINSAGMLHPSGRGETSLKDVSAEGLSVTLMTNALGPTLMTKYFSPLLAKGLGVFGLQAAEPKARHSAVLVNMSAKVGSITDNGLGGWYSYRMSKAALNMATKNLSIELGRGRNKVICVALHPGTVDTDLSRPYHKGVPNLFTVEHSVNCLMDVINGLTLKDSGKYLTYDRTELPF
ncbi:C-signal-like [Haliotis cracherodii]|uniref:C-signal-like n=1 Tax=Haliotis cracherodii TaxID=6455 RepID=UPI0039E858F2